MSCALWLVCPVRFKMLGIAAKYDLGDLYKSVFHHTVVDKKMHFTQQKLSCGLVLQILDFSYIYVIVFYCFNVVIDVFALVAYSINNNINK